MTAAARLSRALVHGWAVLLGYPWRQCAACGGWFGGQEQPATEHLETIPGGEDDHRLLCPACIDAGVGCRAHAVTERPFHHDGCEFVPDEIWPTEDTDEGAHRSGPYRLMEAPTEPKLIVVHRVAESAAAAKFEETKQAMGRHWRTVGDDLGEPELFVPLASGARARELVEAAVKGVEMTEEQRTRAEERKAREAAEQQSILDKHAELMTAIPDVDQNSVIRQIARDHAPKLSESGRLECRGCAQIEDWNGDGEFDPYWPDAPCPAWSTIRAHFEKRIA